MGSARVEYHASKGNAGMRTEVTKKLFTVAEYYQMADAGIIGPEERVELIDGEIIQMSPIGDRNSVAASPKPVSFSEISSSKPSSFVV